VAVQEHPAEHPQLGRLVAGLQSDVRLHPVSPDAVPAQGSKGKIFNRALPPSKDHVLQHLCKICFDPQMLHLR